MKEYQLSIPLTAFMERLSNDEQEVDSDFSRRCSELLVLQRTFLFDKFVPQCEAMGMEEKHMNALIPKFIMGLGDVYRRTNITEDHFLNTLREITERLLGDAFRHKYFLNIRYGCDVGWDEAIRSICVTRTSEVQVDIKDCVAYHDVYFPLAVHGAEKRDGRRLRSVIYVDSTRKSEQIADDVFLTEFMGEMRRSINDVLADT